jgi:hypothetical protein
VLMIVLATMRKVVVPASSRRIIQCSVIASSLSPDTAAPVIYAMPRRRSCSKKVGVTIAIVAVKLSQPY